MIFILDNQTKKYCLLKKIFLCVFLQCSSFYLAFHLIGYMQPHKRQKSHRMNIGTVSFSNTLHKSTPIRMHIAGTFRISLSHILMKSVRMWTVGLLGLFGLHLHFRLIDAALFGRAAGEATHARWPHPHRVTRVGRAKPGGMGVRIAGLIVLGRIGTVATVRVLFLLIVVVVGGGAVVLVGVGG